MKFAAKNALSRCGPYLVIAVAVGVLAGATATEFAAGDDGRVQPATARLNIERAADAALAAVPGHIADLGLHHNGRTLIWEADVLAVGGTWRELHIDAGNGRVLSNEIDASDKGDRRAGGSRPRDYAKALRSAKITARQAVRAAVQAVPGTAVSVDFEYRQTRYVWEVDITTGNGRKRELRVDATTGKATAHR
ncbi:PepSY domain-containing protein [Actinomadura sp. 6N118]|uniref:PepSY domain-containing protein n=1 Tax=Actinomadura sp. 6N118 TaxID=3375151 RepID=UPI0037936493